MEIRSAAGLKILYLPHALRQMSRSDRMIDVEEIRQVARKGDIIEDYPEDVRGHSALLLGHGEGGRAIHIVCAPKPEYLAIITAYLPDPGEWSEDFRRRMTS